MTTTDAPGFEIDPSLRRLEPQQVQAIAERLQLFVAEQLARHAGPLAAMGEAAGVASAMAVKAGKSVQELEGAAVREALAAKG